MAKLFCIASMNGGNPDFGLLPYYAVVLAGDLPGIWGAYIVAGTPAQLQDINALPSVYGICMVTEGETHWAELDTVISSAVRSRINGWLTARGYPTIPAGWTYRQVIIAIFKRINPNYTLENTDIPDVG